MTTRNTTFFRILSLLIIFSMLLSACDALSGQGLQGSGGLEETPTEEVVEPPTAEPPTAEPPTAEPPTAEPPTAEPPTAEPPTAEAPTAESPTETPSLATETPAAATATATPTVAEVTLTTEPKTGDKVEVVWDKSSVEVLGDCLVSGEAQFTVKNTGDAGDGDMDAPTSWRLYVDGDLVQSGSLQLKGGEVIALKFGPYPGSWVKLEVDQRPGHPGSSVPQAEVNCGEAEETPTPVSSATATPVPTATPSNDPRVGLSVACNNDLSATFTISNVGGALTGGSYTITEPGQVRSNILL